MNYTGGGKSYTMVIIIISCVGQDVERAKRIGDRMLELYPHDASIYVTLANTLSAAGHWEEALKIKKAMGEKGAKKIAGRSWIEVAGKIHTFVMDDQVHPAAERIHSKWREVEQRIRGLGYEPDTSWVLHEASEEERRARLCKHSEKMAICYGLLVEGESKKEKEEEEEEGERRTLVVGKNLRMCGDCHNATKLIAMAYGREIIVRDAKRFHHFTTDGHCSCHDFY